MIVEINYSARCKDCKYFKKKYALTKKGVPSKVATGYECSQNHSIFGPRQYACDDFKYKYL